VDAQSGTASVSIESLSGSAEGVIVDYRRGEGSGGTVYLWERWPEGEQSYEGEWVRLNELDFWPAAVGAESVV
jgi:hypothetical protein